MWQPLVCNDDLVVRLQPVLDASRLPVPEDDPAAGVTTRYPPPIRREPNLRGVACNAMPCKPLLAVLAEVVGVVDENLVVERLRCEILFCRQESESGL